MALILSLETSTKTCSVALHQDGTLLGLQEIHMEKSHSALLNVMIRDLLEYCEVNKGSLSAVAVSMGPGSYTGLRIGVSVAKGLCFALDIPLIAVNTLEAMAWQVNHFNMRHALLCPMIDARRMEVYCLIQSSDGKQLMPTSAVIVEEDTFQDYLPKGELWFFGNGAEKCLKVLNQYDQFVFIPQVEPSAEGVGALAGPKFEQQAFEDLAYFAPFYLKEFRTTKPKRKA